MFLNSISYEAHILFHGKKYSGNKNIIILLLIKKK